MQKNKLVSPRLRCAVLAAFLLCACAGTSTHVQTVYHAQASEQFLVEVQAPMDVSTSAMGHLQERIEKGLRARKMLAQSGNASAKTIHIAISDYRMRHARQLGILAGKDRIRSEVRITAPGNGAAVGAFAVETETAAESANTSDLLDEHVEAIFTSMR